MTAVIDVLSTVKMYTLKYLFRTSCREGSVYAYRIMAVTFSKQFINSTFTHLYTFVMLEVIQRILCCNNSEKAEILFNMGFWSFIITLKFVTYVRNKIKKV